MLFFERIHADNTIAHFLTCIGRLILVKPTFVKFGTYKCFTKFGPSNNCLLSYNWRINNDNYENHSKLVVISIITIMASACLMVMVFLQES